MGKTVEEITAMEEQCKFNAGVQQEYGDRFRGEINALLELQTDSARAQLVELVESENFQKMFSLVTDMAYMMQSAHIYKEELRRHSETTIWDGMRNIQEVTEHIQRVKFLLWRIEFYPSKRTQLDFMQYVVKNKVSAYQICHMIHISSMDKFQQTVNLAGLFMDYQMDGYAFAMLQYADQQLPGEESILCTMAQLCLESGKKWEALECLNRVQKPTEITEKLRRACSNGC